MPLCSIERVVLIALKIYVRMNILYFANSYLGMSPSKKFLWLWWPAVSPYITNMKLPVIMVVSQTAIVHGSDMPPVMYIHTGSIKGIKFFQVRYLPSCFRIQTANLKMIKECNSFEWERILRCGVYGRLVCIYLQMKTSLIFGTQLKY